MVFFFYSKENTNLMQSMHIVEAYCQRLFQMKAIFNNYQRQLIAYLHLVNSLYINCVRSVPYTIYSLCMYEVEIYCTILPTTYLTVVYINSVRSVLYTICSRCMHEVEICCTVLPHISGRIVSHNQDLPSQS